MIFWLKRKFLLSCGVLYGSRLSFGNKNPSMPVCTFMLFCQAHDKINVQITLEPLQLFCIKFDWYWKIKINFKIGSLLEASYALGRTLEKGRSVVQVEEVESSLWLAPLNSPWLYMKGIFHGLVDLLKNIPLGYWSGTSHLTPPPPRLFRVKLNHFQ